MEIQSNFKFLATLEESTFSLSNGLRIPKIGYGTTRRISNTDEIIYEAIKVGYRLFDTALMYENEKTVGKGVAKALQDGLCKREDLFITTKVHGKGRANLKETFANQLIDLQLDYVDLYLIHFPLPEFDPITKKFKLEVTNQELWVQMEELVNAGKIKSIGVSNFNVPMLLDLLTYAKIKPVIHQFELNPYFIQDSHVKLCKMFDIRPIAYNSLCGGPYMKTTCQELKLQKEFDLLKEPIILEISNKKGKSPGQIAMSWALSQGIVVQPNTKKADRLKENFESTSFELSPDEIEEISKLNHNQRFNNPDLAGKDFVGGLSPFA